MAVEIIDRLALPNANELSGKIVSKDDKLEITLEPREVKVLEFQKENNQ